MRLIIDTEMNILFGERIDEFSRDRDAAVGAQMERAVDRRIEDTEGQLALCCGITLDLLLDQFLDMLGHLVRWKVDRY